VDRILIGDSCEVLVDRGVSGGLLPERTDREKAAILTQPGARAVATGLAASMGVEHLIVDLPDREEAKTLDTVGLVYDRLAEFNLGRHDTVVGVGGGAVTDVAGFVAATWLRGVESVLVPTTMLGAVDAAIGGKTGINVGGKNLVGAFWHPSRVVVDLDVLDRLPGAIRLEGDAEALKTGLIGDPEIVTEYERSGGRASLDVIVPRSIAVKAAVVDEDFRESGRRAILNFGHTIGHAVEIATGLPHGFAVSVGMVAAGLVSERRYGFDHSWLSHLVFAIGLPVAAAGVSVDTCRELIARDKKRSAEGIRMVLLRAVGDPVLDTVTDEELDVALRSIGAE
jgi:3-dehydroquinate synthase